ncbi:MAG: polysaccharide deacetylase family protein [Gammaproteobacteria bacterium]|nr:polysaccharide deacetylase family protein [Gammaproteobacteria bacterium]
MPKGTNQIPVLTVQVDVDTLDNLFVFYGIDGSQRNEDDPVYRLALPRFADFFDKLGLRATFFVIGKNLSGERNRQVVRQLHAAGHEIANHTQNHRYDFSRLSRQHKYNEIDQAGHLIERVIGQKPVGFRAPGYDVDREVFEILTELGYRYDSSIMPSFVSVPFRLVHRLISKAKDASRYGGLALSCSPNAPYRPSKKAIWRRMAKGTLWEIPVSCVPYFRLPFYANFNLFTGETLFELSAALLRGRSCNYVFHAVEMLDRSEFDPRLLQHPNARLPLDQKLDRCRGFLQKLSVGRRVLLSKDLAVELDSMKA